MEDVFQRKENIDRKGENAFSPVVHSVFKVRFRQSDFFKLLSEKVSLQLFVDR